MTRTNGLVSRLRSILVYKETEEYVTAAAAFDGRLQAAKYLLWNPIVYSVFPERRYQIKVEPHGCLTRRVWMWRGRWLWFGEWRRCEFND